MITGTAYFDLSRDDQARDRDAVRQMYSVPPAVRVVLFVGRRDFPHPDTVHHLREYVDTHHLDFQGAPGAVSAWVQTMRHEAPDVGRWTV